jgi:DNA-binding GntR family transcriptional regulator
MEKAMFEHAKLIRLIRGGSFEEAAALLSEHIGTVREDLIKVLQGK